MTKIEKYRLDCSNFAKRIGEFMIPFYNGGKDIKVLQARNKLLGTGNCIRKDGTFPFGEYQIRQTIYKGYNIYADSTSKRKLLDLKFGDFTDFTAYIRQDSSNFANKGYCGSLGSKKVSRTKYIKKDFTYKDCLYSLPYGLYVDAFGNLYCEIIYLDSFFGGLVEQPYFIWKIFNLQTGDLVKSMTWDERFSKCASFLVSIQGHAGVFKGSVIADFLRENKSDRLYFQSEGASVDLDDVLIVNNVKLYKVY